MSDERLRDLERTFRETGTPEAETAWLRERVRVGALPVSRLELSAGLGHAPAQQALGPASDWRGVAALFGSTAPTPAMIEQADRWSRRLWHEAPGFARETWLKLAALALKHRGAGDLAQQVRHADDAELKRLSQRAEETLRDTNPARGICFELSDDQAEQLQRDMRDWERRHAGRRILAELPQVLERAREGQVLKTHRVLLDDDLTPVARFADWVRRQDAPTRVHLTPPPSA